MTTAELLVSLRYKLRDTDFSIYQIVDALNYVINEISLALNSVTSSLIIESAALTLTANEASLPSDLETIINVGGYANPLTNIPITEELTAYTYQIDGNKIRAEGSTVTIYYKKSLPSYSTTDGSTLTPTTIDLPVSFNNMIRDSIVAHLTGQPINIQPQVLKLIASRDGKKRPQRLIFTL